MGLTRKVFLLRESACLVRLGGNGVQKQTSTLFTKALVVKPLHPALGDRQVKSQALSFPDSSACQKVLSQVELECLLIQMATQ